MSTSKSELNIEIRSNADKALSALKSVTTSLKRLEVETKKSSNATKNIDKSFTRLAKSSEDLNSSLKAIVASFLAFESIKSTVSLMADLEEGFIGVQKTTGLAGEEFQNLKDDILDLSTKMAGVSTEELQAIAETAGQLGIKGSKNITEFTRVIAMMGVATNLTAEEAAKAMAQLGNSLKEPIENYERMGSVINELSNNTTATAKDIVDIAQRFGGLGKTIGLTTSQIFGLSSAMKDFGFNNEVAGTALNQLFGKMLTETKKFAFVTGKSVKDWSKLVSTEPVKALKVFLKEFDKLDKISKANTLKDLGLGDQAVIQATLKMASGIDALNKSLKIGAEEWKRNQSLQKEYEASSKSFNAQIEQTKNSFKSLAVKVGDELLPVLKDGNEALRDWVNDLDKKDVEQFAKTISSLTKAFGGLFDLIGKLNDIAFPDWLSGKNTEATTIIGAVADGWSKFLTIATNGFDVLNSKADLFYTTLNDSHNSTKKLEAQTRDVMGGTANQIKLTTLAIQAQIFENKKNIAEFKKYDGAKPIIDDLTKENQKLEKQLKKLGFETKNIDKIDSSNKKAVRSTKEVTKAIEEATKKRVILKQSEIEAIEKTNQKREVSYTKTLNSLEQKEQSLSNKIKNINEKLQADLQKINNDRLASIESIEDKIRDIKLKGATDLTKYKENEKQIEIKYAQAKQALIEGNLEAYKRYSQAYQALVLENANSEIGQIEKNKQVNIEKLKALEVLENDYYNKKEAKVKADAEAQKQSINAQLQGVKAQIQATKALLQLVTQLNQTISGRKTFSVDSTQAEQQIKSLDDQIKQIDEQLKKGGKVEIKANTEPAKQKVTELKQKVDTTSTTIIVNSDSDLAKKDVDSILQLVDNSVAKFKVESDTQGAISEAQKAVEDIRRLQTLVPVNGDTTELMSKTLEAEKQISDLQTAMKVGADTEEVDSKVKALQDNINNIKAMFAIEADTKPAKKELDSFSKSVGSVNSKIEVGANVTPAVNTVKTLQQKVSQSLTTIKVNADISNALSAINKLKQTTYSTHIVRVKSVSESSTGGLIPQHLAVGGTFRGSGRVSGYDPTDSDKVNAKLTGGEFVIKRLSAKKIGFEALNFINKFGKIPTPKFASGGAISPIQPTSSLTPINLHIPTIDQPVQMFAPEDVAKNLVEYLETR